MKRVEFVSDRVSYTVLSGRWCNIIVLNVHAPSEEEGDDSKTVFMRNQSRYLINFLSTIRKFYYEILMQKRGDSILSRRQLGMSNDNGVRIINFAALKNLIVKGTMSSHRHIHKYISNSPDGKTHNQSDHILRGRRWHWSILDVRSFRGADCDTDHYFVVAKIRERLAVSKQAAQKYDMERFNRRKLNELKVRKQYQIKISNRLAA